MSVSAINQYRVHDGGRDAFLDACRGTFKLIESLGGKPHLRQNLYGGDLTGLQQAIVQFPNASARGTYIDAVTKPENVAKNALVQLQRAGGVTLMSRVFLNETPATEALPAISQVLSVGRYRIAPGRLQEGESALIEAQSIRQSLGVESHRYTLANAGSNTGVRVLTTHATSHADLARIMDEVAAKTEGNGPIPRAIDAGALIQIGNTISTLVAL